jgi:hypothetical protein
MPADNLDNGWLISKINFLKDILWVLVHAMEVNEMTGVGEAIEVDHPLDFWPADDVVDQIRADEAGAACDKQDHTEVQSAERRVRGAAR